MSDNQNLNDIVENVNNNLEHEMQMQKIREKVLQKFQEYKKTIDYMAADAPIEILCLPLKIEKILIKNGLFRIYNLFDVDFTKIKGLGKTRIGQLTSRLDQFFLML